jgi:hypothetical protein
MNDANLLYWIEINVIVIVMLGLQSLMLMKQEKVVRIVRRAEKEITMAFEELQAAIQESKSVQAAAIVLIKDLADKISDLSRHPDEEAMRQLARELRQKANELAGAIALHEGEEEDGGEEGEEGEEPSEDEHTTRRR